MFMSTFYYFLLTVLSESEIFISSVLAFSLESTKYNDNVGSKFLFFFQMYVASNAFFKIHNNLYFDHIKTVKKPQTKILPNNT